MKKIKEVFVRIYRWIDDQWTFINTIAAITLVGFGIFIGYLWFSPTI